MRLQQSELSALGELEKGEQQREDFPWLRLLRKNVFPLRAGTDREQRAHDSYRPIHVKRTRNDIVDVGFPGEPRP